MCTHIRRQFCQINGNDLVYAYCNINKCIWCYYPLDYYSNKTKNFELSMARRVKWCVDLKLPSLMAGPIKPSKYFPVARIISQLIFKFVFLNMHACANNVGFCWDDHMCDSKVSTTFECWFFLLSMYQCRLSKFKWLI